MYQILALEEVVRMLSYSFTVAGWEGAAHVAAIVLL